MAWKQIASGSFLEAADIERYEAYIGEGQRGLLQLDLRAPVSQGIVTELKNKLNQAGVEEAQVTTGSPVLRISWRKGFPWLGVVVAAILGVILLAILIVGWQLFKEIISVVPDPFKGLAVGGMILVAVVVAALAWKRRR